jgi:hypothetical protein
MNEGTFVLLPSNKRWGNEMIYGALFLCKDFDFYARIFDAYHACSMSTLLRNHDLDLHHRMHVHVTPIYFKSLDELSRLKYREGEPVYVQTYLGNPKHPKIANRLNSTVSYRITDGIDTENYKKLFWEVTK